MCHRIAIVTSILVTGLVGITSGDEEDFTPKLLIAVSSYHPRPKHPTIYFYHHDGQSLGKKVGEVTVSGKRSDYHPSLSADGRWCAFASEEENQTSRIRVWDLQEKKLLELPEANKSPNGQLHASISGSGKLVAFSAWSNPQASGRWDVLLFDVAGNNFLPLGVNTQALDERMPCLSGDGRLLAYTSNAKGGVGRTDIYFYDLSTGESISDAKLNSSHMDVEPSLSADGRLVAFVSDRREGQGGRDIYLYDRDQSKLLPLPNLNSVAHEQSPSLSSDGRYLTFVSERTAGEGERDVFLYDRQSGKLLPTPQLNGKQEDMDPCVIVLAEQND